MFELVWTPQAERDLTEIFDFIARDSTDYAETTVMNICDRVESLQHFPQSGRRVPELKRSHLREIIVGSYRVIHEATNDAVVIITVIHSRRNALRRLSGEPDESD